MKTRLLFCSLALVISAPFLSAQTPGATPPAAAEPTVNQDNFWSVTLEGGEYDVLLSRISSVSRHKYLLDGTLIVDEVTIDTTGQALARFYFIQPVTSASTSAAGKLADQALERAQELSDKVSERTGTDLQNMVVKKYPDTTHARTIEYRILTATQLNTIFESAKKAWQSGKGRKLTVK